MKSIIFLFTLFFIVGCGAKSEQGYMSEDRLAMEEPGNMEDNSESYGSSNNGQQKTNENFQQTSSTPDTIQKAQKVIKNGRLDIEVDVIEAAKATVDATVKQLNGYFEKETFHSNSYESRFELTISVPSENFESLISGLEAGGNKILFKEILAKDVTEEYMDLNTRLQNNKAYIKRYNELLKSAKSVKDILDIQEKIRYIEEEMDSKIGRINYINDRVRFSRLNVQLIKKHEGVDQESRNFGKQISNALSNGFNFMLDFILVVFNLWPFILIGLGLFVFRKRIRNSFRKKTVE
ncbi:MAG: hypothetical protein ACI8X3_003286 [Saprospiraceae bacterium]|jgi:hypothetical protein